jgi:hypothetical protein
VGLERGARGLMVRVVGVEQCDQHACVEGG